MPNYYKSQDEMIIGKRRAGEVRAALKGKADPALIKILEIQAEWLGDIDRQVKHLGADFMTMAEVMQSLTLVSERLVENMKAKREFDKDIYVPDRDGPLE